MRSVSPMRCGRAWATSSAWRPTRRGYSSATAGTMRTTPPPPSRSGTASRTPPLRSRVCERARRGSPSPSQTPAAGRAPRRRSCTSPSLPPRASRRGSFAASRRRSSSRGRARRYGSRCGRATCLCGTQPPTRGSLCTAASEWRSGSRRGTRRRCAAPSGTPEENPLRSEPEGTQSPQRSGESGGGRGGSFVYRPRWGIRVWEASAVCVSPLPRSLKWQRRQ
mmetsp:Transcript_21130/g.67341  ORF Transcript_21130/g.67341 Transcript_21130/m.67341 type:complete len:222 (+) Transcript_21130:1313-1978(+)